MSTREERLELRMQKDASYKRPNQPAIAMAVAHIARAASMRGKMQSQGPGRKHPSTTSGSGGGGGGGGQLVWGPQRQQPRRSSSCSYRLNNSLSEAAAAAADDDVFVRSASPHPLPPGNKLSTAAETTPNVSNHRPLLPGPRTREELLKLQEIREKAREQERLEREREQDRLDREELVPDSKKAPQVGLDNVHRSFSRTLLALPLIVHFFITNNTDDVNKYERLALRLMISYHKTANRSLF